MLEYLHLKNVGPAPEMELELAPRLNLLTGDNGLGKSFLLDVAWWALTRTWPQTWNGKGVVPDLEEATIKWIERRGAGAVEATTQYNFDDAVWRTTDLVERPRHDPQGGGLVLYVRVDGGISVHDPLRTGEDFRLPTRQRAMGRSHAFQFRDFEIWEGLNFDEGDKASRVCEGLVRDVVRWAVEPDSEEFTRLAALVEQLAGEEPFRLTRKVGRVYLDDARDFPHIDGPGGEEPITRAPAGLRRILGLAYLIVWAWREHRVAATLKKRAPNDSFVLLFDEVENHLHPRWQRTILPKLLHALSQNVRLQVIASTHSPLVLASAEPFFDANQDAWFDLDLDRKGGLVELRRRPFVHHGDVSNWLASEAFDLKDARSLESERAMEKARALLRRQDPTLAEADDITKELIAAGVSGLDPFWVGWGSFVERLGGRI
jgi:hypothetical protein